jgi:Mor family transcriptional regulator
MSYINATTLLPEDVIELIQDYIEGEYIYIPKKATNKKAWGENTTTRQELADRNTRIFEKYLQGHKVSELADMFYLSPKSIQRIIRIKKEEQL